jgi:hypothetical protein
MFLLFLLFLLTPVAIFADDDGSGTTTAVTPSSSSLSTPASSGWSCLRMEGATCRPCPNLRGLNNECPGTTSHRIQVDCTDIALPKGTVANSDGTKWWKSCEVANIIDQKRQDVKGVLLFEIWVAVFCFASSVYLCYRRRQRNYQLYTALSQ